MGTSLPQRNMLPAGHCNSAGLLSRFSNRASSGDYSTRSLVCKYVRSKPEQEPVGVNQTHGIPVCLAGAFSHTMIEHAVTT